VGFLVRILVNAATIALAARVVPGIHLNGVGPALLAGLVLGLINALVRPVLVIVTFPLTLLTLGLFLLVLNGGALFGALAASGAADRFGPVVHVTALHRVIDDNPDSHVQTRAAPVHARRAI